MAASESVRVGVDLVAIEDVAASLTRWGRRYERRVFTDGELEDAGGPLPVRAARLAARFAAKEAVIKVLGDAGAAPWPHIEVRRRPGGAPTLHLTGAAAARAAAGGFDGWAVSLTHERAMAAAVVVATCRSRG